MSHVLTPYRVETVRQALPPVPTPASIWVHASRSTRAPLTLDCNGPWLLLVVLTCHRIYGELTYLILNPDRRSVMPSVRPEIEAFVSAAHELLAFDKLGIALTDEEEAALTDCLRRLDEHLLGARSSGVSGCPPACPP